MASYAAPIANASLCSQGLPHKIFRKNGHILVMILVVLSLRHSENVYIQHTNSPKPLKKNLQGAHSFVGLNMKDQTCSHRALW